MSRSQKSRSDLEIPNLPSISTLHGVFAQARAEPSTVTLFKGWTRLTTDDHGEMQGDPLQGFYAAETQYISYYVIHVNGSPVRHRLTAQLGSNEWAGTGAILHSGDSGALPEGKLPKGAIEVRTLRRLGEGWTELIFIKNNGVPKRKVDFKLSFACPIRDSELDEEMKRDRKLPKRGEVPQLFRDRESIGFRFRKDFGKRNRHAPTRELERLYGSMAPKKGERVRRDLEIRIRPRSGSPRARIQIKRGTVNEVRALAVLGPREELCLEFRYEPIVDGHRMRAPELKGLDPLPRAHAGVPEKSLQFDSGNSTLNLVIGQAMLDIRSLKLPIYGKSAVEHPERYMGFNAGIPRYLGVFSRDSLITAWQSAFFELDALDPMLSRLELLQGVRHDPWRDEEPNRLPHERRVDPLAAIGKTNREIYYGDVTSTPFWILALSSLYQWTGDLELLKRHEATLRRCVQWIRWRLKKGKGFIYYAPALPKFSGDNRNQAWKDSGDAIVDHKGRICTPPLAVCEIQGYAYQALIEATEMLRTLRHDGNLETIRREAEALKKRFNRAFWLESGKFYAMALDRKGRALGAKASNIGHCLITRILDDDKIPWVVRDLMADDMFSGWGIRTLSSENPGFDPFSYHRGSVWPVENAIIANGMAAHGYIDEAHRIMAAQLGLAALFEHMRLPEVISGHSRSHESPVPGLYSFANLLQAWSVSALFQYIQMTIGLVPRADQGIAFLDPYLPEWIPWMELRNVQVGDSNLHLRFDRGADGKSHWKILEKTGTIDVRPGTPNAFGREQAASRRAG